MRGLLGWIVGVFYGIARGLRRCFLVTLLLQPFPAMAAEITRAEECRPAIAKDAAAAREAAAVWSRTGGGAEARLCEAAALEALGALGSAAVVLTELAEDENRALIPSARAMIFQEAGRVWLLAERPDLALGVMDSADRITPATPDRLILRARAAAALEDWAAAEVSLRAVLAAEPEDGLAHALLAASLRHLDQPEAALGEAERAVALDPGLPEGLFEKAAALKATGKATEAGQVWLRLIEEHPDSAFAVLARRNLEMAD